MIATRARSGFCFVLLLMLGACSPKQAGTPANRNLLTAEELQRSGYADSYTAVQSLRPHWLQIRGRTSSRSSVDTIKVYLDGSLLGGVEQLRQIMTRSISSLRYYDGLEASQRWGMDHGQGAIAISTRGT
jgi:hypothetical protein